MSAEAIPLPHSIEAEEQLLSCCLIDGAEVVSRCNEAGLEPDSFFDPKHAIIFKAIQGIASKRAAVDTAVLGEELKASKQLDRVGGPLFLARLGGIVPTTAQAVYFVQVVLSHWLRRRWIISAMALTERARDLTLPIDDVLGDFLPEAYHPGPSVGHEMSLDSLLAFDKKADPDCLMGRRFLCRTGGCVIVAPSGVGKSVLALQLGACAALKRPFFGLQMAIPMRVLVIQGEDDFGDVAESVQGFVHGLAVSGSELDELRARLRIVRWNDASGHKFLSRLRAEHAKWPFDLVIINPLFSYCGCSVSDQREMSTFLRNGLNPILNETRSSAIIIHHTNKPSNDPNAQPSDLDALYIGSGSAELTNWARAYITLQCIKSAGGKVHKMIFAKRGHRAGIVDADGNPTTSVLIEHSPEGLCWVPSDYAPQHGEGGQFQPKFDKLLARQVYDGSLDWAENERRIARKLGMSERAVRNHRRDLETAA